MGSAAVAALCVLATAASIASAAPSNVNLSALAGNQVEGAIAVNPSNPSEIYAVAMNAAPAGGLVAARSSNGGTTWTRGTVAPPGEGIPTAASDPSLSWDSYGNLFLSYINLVKAGSKWAQILAISTNGGATFKFRAALASLPDQPTVTTGPGGAPGTGSVWVSWSGADGYMYAAGASVTGLGAVGAFQTPQRIPGTFGLSYGDIAVGPNGQVMLSAGPAAAGSVGGSIVTSLSAGLGAPFSEAVAATTTGMGGFESIPAQPSRGVDSESGLAYDRSGGPRSGRVYLMYNDASPLGSPALEVYVRHSDDNGATWSEPVKVNEGAGASNFLPRLALDQRTGDIGVTWYDTRTDAANVRTQYFGSFSSDGGETFTPNVQISAGTSDEAGADPPPAGYPDLDYGDYTGSSFAGGKLFPIWADNSNSTGDNPNGTLSSFDVYTAGVAVPTAPPTAPIVKISLPAPDAAGWYTAVPVEGQVTATDPSAQPYPITEVTCSGANLGPVTGLGTGAASATISISRQGRGTVMCHARDSASLEGESTPFEAKVDSVPPQLTPAISPSGSPILVGATATAEPNATDPLLEGFASGIASAACGTLETATAGPKSASCEAVDMAGNRTETRVPYIVGYGITILSPKPDSRRVAGSSISAVFELMIADGQPISTVLARSLGCTVTVAFADGAPVCARYAKKGLFRISVPVPAGTLPGTYALVVNVTAGGANVATQAVKVRIRA